jgi:hypothetical protein
MSFTILDSSSKFETAIFSSSFRRIGAIINIDKKIFSLLEYLNKICLYCKEKKYWKMLF